MLKSITIPAAALTLAVAAWLLMPLRSHEAAADTGPALINVVELDIVPAQMGNWLAAAKDNCATAIKEPGCREFNITVSNKDPNHVLLFEIWDSAAALDSHRAADHFKAYQATTKDMVAKRDLRQFSPVALNMRGT